MLEIRTLSGLLPLREIHMQDDNALERAGILTGMKLNMFSGGSVLRWGYLSDDELRQRGLNDNQITKLKSKLRKAEQLYLNKGGTRDDFAKAILQGYGNDDKKVSTNPQGLSGMGTSFLESRVLSASPRAIADSITTTGEGLAGEEENPSKDALSKASGSITKIGGFAQSVADLANALSSATSQQGTSVPEQASTSNLPDTTKTAGFGDLLTPKNIGIAGGLGLLGFLFISNLNPSSEEKKKLKNAKKRSKTLSGTSKTARPKAASLGAINFY